MASLEVSSGRSNADGACPPGPAAAARRDGERTPAAPPRSRMAARQLRRYPDRGVFGGVDAGLALHFSVSVRLVRLLTMLVFALGGLGVAVYALAWALIPVAPESQGKPRPRGAWKEGALLALGAAAILVGLRVAGLRLGDTWVVPLVLGACGMALVWRPTVDPPGGVTPGAAAAPRGQPLRRGHIDAPRVAIGGLLVAFSSAWLLHGVGVLKSLGTALGAVAIVGAVLALLLGPWFLRLARSLSLERAARIREQERAEMAAHLHDSVLQTLALIQKRAAEPRAVAGLARRQERELRRWLIDGDLGESAPETVAEALARAAANVEELHGVRIEVVSVGDGPLDARLEAVVQAAREAMTNAAKFSGSDRVDVYAEMGDERVEVFVRDRGVGFDPQAIPPDRRGVRDSILARIRRHHGHAEIHSAEGGGTEVELQMARAAPA
jgi:signal transduction histidine kinase